MRRVITILAAALILAGCTMTEVETDQEQMKTEKPGSGKQTGPVKGIHIVIPITNS